MIVKFLIEFLFHCRIRISPLIARPPLTAVRVGLVVRHRVSCAVATPLTITWLCTIPPAEDAPPASVLASHTSRRLRSARSWRCGLAKRLCPPSHPCRAAHPAPPTQSAARQRCTATAARQSRDHSYRAATCRHLLPAPRGALIFLAAAASMATAARPPTASFLAAACMTQLVRPSQQHRSILARSGSSAGASL